MSGNIASSTAPVAAFSGVPRGRLDDRRAGLERAVALGVFDDAEGQAILDGTTGVRGLELDVHGDVLGREPVDAHHGRAADGLGGVIPDHVGSPYWFQL